METQKNTVNENKSTITTAAAASFEDLDEQVEFRLPRDHVPQSYLDEDSFNASSMDSHLPETNIGFRLLAAMGWSKGKGLGSGGSGRIEPIRIDYKQDFFGIGKQDELLSYHRDSAAKRKTMESELIAEETPEKKAVREVSKNNHCHQNFMLQALRLLHILL